MTYVDAEHRALQAEYELLVRAKYSAKDKAALLKAGKAMKNANGKASYPVADAEDLAKAIKAVGRGGSDHDAIRKHIITQAKKLGLSSKIPDNWNSDGSLKVDSNSARADGDATKDCPTCAGKGKIMAGKRDCPTCGATGKVPDKSAKQSNAREPWGAEQREAALTEAAARDGDMTFSDTQQAVKTAICDALPASEYSPGDDYLYVQDITDDWAVYSVNYDGDLFQVSYECGDGGCTVDLAGRTEVARVTTYAPVPKPAAAAAAPTPADTVTTKVLNAGGVQVLSAENNSAGREPRPRVPVQIKRSVWADPVEWAWPVSPQAPQVRTAEGDDAAPTADFTGYASTTASPGEPGYDVSDFLGTYVERMNPGSFTKTLREAPNVPQLFNHAGIPLASTGAGTSSLCEDKVGLRNDATWDLRSSVSNDVALALARGDLSKMSFSFAAIKQSWSADYEERDVSEARLYDTSVVTFPANPGTTAALRAAMQEGMGREGLGIFMRMASGLRVERRDSGVFVAMDDAEDLDRAFMALRAADEATVKQYGCYARARTFIVGDALHQARAGAAISAANAAILSKALVALHNADDALTSVDSALDEGQQAISALLKVANPDDDEPDAGNGAKSGTTPNNSGTSGDAGGGATTSGQGNPISPSDGAGARGRLDELKARGRRYTSPVR